MSLVNTYSNIALRPAHSPELAVKRNIRLPYGGPYGVGGKFAKGKTVGCVSSATAANAVWTIALTGTPTGAKIYLTYSDGYKVYTAETANAYTAIPTGAQLQTALESIFGSGNVTVVKTSLSYACTFGGQLANIRMGGLLTPTATFDGGTTPAITLTRTTKGSCGSGQWDLQDDAASDGTQVPKGFLERDYFSDVLGGNNTEFGTDAQPFSPPCYVSGFFNAADISGLTTTGLALIGRLAEGADLSDADAIVKI